MSKSRVTRPSRVLVTILALLGGVLPLAVVSIATAPPAAAALPTGFTDTVAFSGLTQPTNIRFAPDGRIFVAEKGGQIKVFDSLSDPTPTVFADLRVETYDFWDRGLLSVVLNPDWPTSPTAPGNRFVYAAYSRDADIGGVAPKWGSATPSASEFDTCPTPPGANTDGCVISGRLVRFAASGTSDVAASGPTTLLDGWCQQFPSHSVGDLEFGNDGMLYMTGGEGANFNTADWGQFKNLCGDPPTATGTGQTAPTAEGGALRAQSVNRPAGQPVLLSGALLRLNPGATAADGFIAGAPGNPFAGSADANKARLAAVGFRNPYRLTFRPGTNEAWVANVGWATWESINRVTNPTATPIANFGWPCYEGSPVQPSYQAANLNMCNALYNSPGSVTAPYYQYNHANKVVANETCPTAAGSSITGEAFYPTTGGSFPAAYNGALFFADYTRNCIWAMQVGANGLPDPTKIVTFDAPATQPVDLAVDPVTHDLFYADLEQGTAGAGTIHRVSFQGTGAPVAKITTTPSPPNIAAGQSVTFDGTTSTGTNLTYAWDLGSGNFTDATTPTASKTFATAGTFTVRLRVTSGTNTSIASTTVTVGSPPVPTISAPTSALTWSVGDPIVFAGSAKDGNGNPLPASALSWSALVHHCPTAGNCHVHPGIYSANGVASGTFPAPDHSYPSDLQLTLTATDTNGLTGSTSVTIQPNSTTLTLQTSPSGLSVSTDDLTQASPLTSTVIPGHIASVSAPPTQTLGSQSYQFSSWSDGGAASHNVTVAAATTLTANYTPVTSVSVPAPAAGTWQLNGSATLPSAGVLQLTPATTNKAGTAFYKTAVSSATLTADFDATINSGTGADGLTFILGNPAAGATPTSLGDGGGGLGFGDGPPGIAVTLDTFKSTGDPSANFVGITDGYAATGGFHYLATSTAVPNLRSATRHVKVTVAAGLMTVSVDGVQYMSQPVTLGANVLVGFGGGTGGATDIHSVKNVVITSGAVTTAPALSVSPTSIPFGNVTVGSASAPVSVQISNVGNAPLTVSSVTAPAAPFSATNLPIGGQTIAAGSSVTASVTFSPTSAVASTGSIAIATNGGNSSVALSGTGTAAATPVLSVSPTSVPFGNVAVNSTSTGHGENLERGERTVDGELGDGSGGAVLGNGSAGGERVDRGGRERDRDRDVLADHGGGVDGFDRDRDERREPDGQSLGDGHVGIGSGVGAGAGGGDVAVERVVVVAVGGGVAVDAGDDEPGGFGVLQDRGRVVHVDRRFRRDDQFGDRRRRA